MALGGCGGSTTFVLFFRGVPEPLAIRCESFESSDAAKLAAAVLNLLLLNPMLWMIRSVNPVGEFPSPPHDDRQAVRTCKSAASLQVVLFRQDCMRMTLNDVRVFSPATRAGC